LIRRNKVDRKQLGEKININLAIQSEVEAAKSRLFKASGEKIDADRIVSAGAEAKKISDKLVSEIKEAKANLDSLENELTKSDGELERAGAKVPRLINEAVNPTNIKL